MAASYSFKAKVASRGYHVFKETTWAHASVGDRVVVEVETNQTSVNIDPYSCAVLCNNVNNNTVGHIPREISKHVYFFIKDEGGSVDGHVLSTIYRPSPIPSGGLKIPLLLTFTCKRYTIFQKMKDFVLLQYCVNTI